VQSTQTYHTTPVWLPCAIFGFHLLVMIRSLEQKLLSNGSMAVTVLLNSGSRTALSCEFHCCLHRLMVICWSRKNLVFTATGTGTCWLVSRVCDGPKFSSSTVVLGPMVVSFFHLASAIISQLTQFLILETFVVFGIQIMLSRRDTYQLML
jgi:hypothetical protein